MTRPFSEACERNREPILVVLGDLGLSDARVLEIGSGTGQHAVYFAPRLPGIVWQCSDRTGELPGIRAWLDEAQLPNTPPPVALDVTEFPWPELAADHVFSANTSHIMPWQAVECMFAGIGELLPAGGLFILYGPFNVNRRYTSDSNAQFDIWLRQRDPAMGLRNAGALDRLAACAGLVPHARFAMPANNQILVWQREGHAGGDT